MVFVSLTRLRIRSVRFLPLFVVHMLATVRQVKQAEGFRRGSLLADKHWTFWTLTAWESQESMRRYMTGGAHKKAMPRLLHWCDEASVAHWTQPEEDLPAWIEADRRMRETGRVSKVRHPSPRHAGLAYDAPRVTASGPICRHDPMPFAHRLSGARPLGVEGIVYSYRLSDSLLLFAVVSEAACKVRETLWIVGIS